MSWNVLKIFLDVLYSDFDVHVIWVIKIWVKDNSLYDIFLFFKKIK